MMNSNALLASLLLWNAALFSSSLFAQETKDILVSDEDGNPIPFVQVRCDDLELYSGYNGKVAIDLRCSNSVHFHALGFKDSTVSTDLLRRVERIELESKVESLNGVEVAAQAVDLEELVSEVIEHSWEVYKDHYRTPLRLKMKSSTSLDSQLYLATIDSGGIAHFSNRDWYPLLDIRANLVRYSWDDSPEDLNRYIRFGPNRYLEYHFPLNPIEPPFNRLEESRIEVVRFLDNTEEVRILSDTLSGEYYEVKLRFDYKEKLVRSVEKRLISLNEESPVYGRDTLLYQRPFLLYTYYSFEYDSGRYYLEKASIEKEETVFDVHSGNRVRCRSTLAIQTTGVLTQQEWDEMHNAKNAYYFPNSHRIEEWIQGHGLHRDK